MKQIYQNLMKYGLIILLFFAGGSTWAQVFITEIADPNNEAGARYVELYNAGASSFDLAANGYALLRYTNGNVTPQVPVLLTGTIPSQGYYLISNNSEPTDPAISTFESVYGFAPDEYIGGNGPADSNGDDQILLIDATDYDENNIVIVDIFGVPGEDGSETDHEFEDGRAERKATVTTGNTTWTAAEWNIDNDGGAGEGALDAPDGFDPGAWIGNSTSPLITENVSSFSSDFGLIPTGYSSNTSSFSVTGVNLTEDITVSATSPFEIATSEEGAYSTNVTITQSSGDASGTIFVKFSPSTANGQYYTENIVLSSSGASDVTIPVTATEGFHLYTQDFSSCIDLNSFSSFNVLGDEVWECQSDYVRMNGFSGGAQDNEDWLISQAFDFSTWEMFSDYFLQFETQKNYSGGSFSVLISTDYDGSSDPSTQGTWDDITNDVTLSTGGSFVSSGGYNLSSYLGEAPVYFAFKYTSTTAGAAQWDVDNVMIRASGDIGAPEFQNSRPSISGATTEGFNVNVQINEPATLYYVVLEDGASAPSAAQIMAGTDADDAATVNGNFEVAQSESTSETISGLADNTVFDVYFVAKDVAGNTSAIQMVEATTQEKIVGSFSISSDELVESVLDGAEVEIELSAETFADATLDAANFSLLNAPEGLTINAVEYVSTTEAVLTLAYDGTDFDDHFSNVAIQIAADELTGTESIDSEAFYIIAEKEAENTFTFENTFNITLKGSFKVPGETFDEGAAEISAFDAVRKQVFFTDAMSDVVHVLDATDPSNTTLKETIALGGGPNSVAVYGDVVAVAVEADPKTDNGTVEFYSAVDFSSLGNVTVGALPDMLTFTHDGTKVLVANEGEPSDDYSIDPEGSVSIITLNAENLSNSTVETAGFSAFDAATLRAAGVRIFGPGATVAQDLEPEYITISEDGTKAYVTLQENNALAIVDIETATVSAVKPLGFKDHSLPGNGLDLSDDNGGIVIANWPIKGMYQPDAIASFKSGESTYLVTANEGDAREYIDESVDPEVDVLVEEQRGDDFILDESVFPAGSALLQDAALGRLNFTTTLGDADNNNEYEELYSFGTRSFSVWNAEGELVWDSGDQFEQLIAQVEPDYFNSNNDEHEINGESRSDNKGVEPEGITVGSVNGTMYAFIGFERQGGIAVYDLSNPAEPTFAAYINNRDFTVDAETAEAGDLGPEGLTFVSADNSPTGLPMLVVTNEISGTVSFYQLGGEPEAIAEARAKELGESTIISGIVIGGPNHSSANRVIYDGTAGIVVRGFDEGATGDLQVGDSVVVSGVLSDYNELLQLESVQLPAVLAKGRTLPSPQLKKISEVDETVESELITIENVRFVENGQFAYGNFRIANDESDTLVFRLGSDNHPLVGTAIPTGYVNVTGVVGQFYDDYQLFSELASDIEVLPSEPSLTVTGADDVFDFGAVQTGETSASQSFTVAGENLSEEVSIVADANFEVSFESDANFESSLSAPIDQVGMLTETTVFVRFAPNAGVAGTINGSIAITSGDEAFDVTLTGVEESVTANKDVLLQGVSLYPNPARNELFIDVETSGVYDVRLITLQGAQISTKAGNGRTNVDLSNLAKGVYVVEVKQGGKVMRAKIVKQ